MLNRHGLEQRFANRTRPKADVRSVAKADPIAERFAPLPEPPSLPRIATSFWERASQKLECVLAGSPAYWLGDPDPERLKLFCSCIDEIRQQCADEGLES